MDDLCEARSDNFYSKYSLTAKMIKIYNEFDCLAIVIGAQQRSNQGIQNQFQRWYFGTEISDSIIIISPSRLIILSKQIMFDKLSYLQEMNPKYFTIQFIIWDNNNYYQQFQNILQILRDENSASSYRIGVNLYDGDQNSVLIAKFLNFLSLNKILTLDGSIFIKELINKENDDIQKNNLVCSRINKHYMNLIIKLIIQMIDKDEDTRNVQISEAIKNQTNQKQNRLDLQKKIKLISDYKIFNLIVQNGRSYNVDAQESSIERLIDDVIIVSFCCQYETSQAYCSRTLIFWPAVQLESIYNTILNVLNFAISLVKEQIQFRQIYKQTQYLWNQIYKDDLFFQSKFPSNVGYIQNTHLKIDADNNEYIQTKMFIVIRMHVSNINVLMPLESEQNTVSICLADCVYVSTDVDNCVITESKKDFPFIAYQRESENGTLLKFQKIQKLKKNQLVEKQKRTQVQFSKIHNDQQELKKIKQKELEAVLNENLIQQEHELILKMNYLEINQYDEQTQSFPLSEIFFDQENSAIFIPIRGTHYQFPAFKIQNINVKQTSQDKAIMQIRFLTNEISEDNREYQQFERNSIFIKEITLENHNIVKLKEIENEINIFRKSTMEKQIQKQQQSEQFSLLPQNPPKLFSLLIKSNQILKQYSLTGSLECLQNRFRFKYSVSDVIDFAFSNIKYCFFVSPLEEIIACLHFEFKVPIKSGKKQYKSIQFYREIEGAIEEVRKKRKYYNIDIISDQKISSKRYEEYYNFNIFIQESELYFRNLNLKFEMLDKQFSFEGNYSLDRRVFQLTQNCLVNIIDQPNIVLPLENVDIVCFEKAQATTLSFDLIAVLKDHESPVIRIEAIDKVYLRMLQEWLNNKMIVFFSTSRPIIWRNVLFSIQKDFTFFVKNGGWNTLIKDYMDHSNTEDCCSLETISSPEFEFKTSSHQLNQKNKISDQSHSENIMREMNVQEKIQQKKRKFNDVD